MSWSATHAIRFRPADGSAVREWLVMLCKDPYSQDLVAALTEEDWRRETPPTWQFRKSDGAWLWRGQPRPQWQDGSLDVQALAEAQPKTLRFARTPLSDRVRNRRG